MSLAKVVLAGGGNRSGKTELAVKHCIDFATGRHPVRSKNRKPPVNIRFCAPTFEDSIIGVTLKKFQQLVKREDLFGGTWETAWNTKSRTLSFCLDGDITTKGSQVRFFTYQQQPYTYAGDDLDACYMDEHGDRKYFIENMARLVDRDGYLFMSMTPDAGMTWEEEEIIERWQNGDPDYQVYFFDSRLNPYLSEKGLADLMKSLEKDPELFKAKIQGQFVALTGLVYKLYQDDRHVIEDNWKIIDQPGFKQVILDAHRNKPHRVLWLHWDKEGNVFAYRERVIDSSTGGIKELARNIKIACAGEHIDEFIMDESLGGTPDLEKKDQAGQLTYITQLNQYGLPFVGTNQASDKSFKTGIDKVKEFLVLNPITGHSRLKIFMTCSELRKEFRKYQFRKGTAEDDQSYRERVRTIDDDLMDCLRYGIMAEPVWNLPKPPVIRYEEESGLPIHPIDIPDTGYDLSGRLAA